MKVGYLQLKPEFGRVKDNVEKAVEYIYKNDADLIVLPELFNTGYTFASVEEVEDLTEFVPGNFTTQRLLHVAKDTDTTIVFGIAEKKQEKYYNAAAIVSPKGFVGKYHKAHLFNKEKLWFNKGKNGFPVFQVNGVTIGLMICFDWIFPEVARILALEGAQIICHCANLVMPYCQKAMFARAVENQVFTITCNRIGREQRGSDDFTFTGGSVIISPKGEYLSEAPTDEEFVSIVEIDPKEAKNKELNEYNNLFKDRRIELFGRLLAC